MRRIGLDDQYLVNIPGSDHRRACMKRMRGEEKKVDDRNRLMPCRADTIVSFLSLILIQSIDSKRKISSNSTQ